MKRRESENTRCVLHMVSMSRARALCAHSHCVESGSKSDDGILYWLVRAQAFCLETPVVAMPRGMSCHARPSDSARACPVEWERRQPLRTERAAGPGAPDRVRTPQDFD